MHSLSFKLTFAFLAVSLTGIAIVAIFAGRITANEVGNIVSLQAQEVLIERLTAYYEQNGSWDGLETAVSNSATPTNGPNGNPPRLRDRFFAEAQFILLDQNGAIILSRSGRDRGQRLSQADLRKAVDIEVDGQIVGSFILDNNPRGRSFPRPPTSFQSTDFILQRINASLFLGAIGAAGIALIIGGIWAQSLTKPLREIIVATHAIAQGDLKQQVPVRSQDELGELATSFNQMSADLSRSRELRRQMTADIAHDLRTPLSIILGHAEALNDGVLPPTADTFNVIYDEAKRLKRLIEDLRTLSLSDAGELTLNCRPTPPQALLERAAIAYTPQVQQKGIDLHLEIPPDLPLVDVDPDRIAQVLDNLLSNAMRHTPPNGRILLTATPANGHVQLRVQDSGSGIPADELPHIFDRFYRADKSRQRQGNSSGLGLAIAKSIIEGHNGRIYVMSQFGQGTTFMINLPSS